MTHTFLTLQPFLIFIGEPYLIVIGRPHLIYVYIFLIAQEQFGRIEGFTVWKHVVA